MPKKISDLIAATVLGDNDSFVFNDVAAGNDKRITAASLLDILKSGADVESFDTMTDLKAFSGQREGKVIDLAGFFSIGDGGRDLLYWKASELKSNHDGITTINPDHNSSVGSANWYDASGDGTDTTGFGCWISSKAIDEVSYKDPIKYKDKEINGNSGFSQDIVLNCYAQSNKIAIGCIISLSDEPAGFNITVNGVTKYTTFNDAGLANIDGSYFESGSIFETSEKRAYQVRLEPGVKVHGIIIRSASPNGIIEDQGSGTHCYPLSTKFNGNYYEVHSELYSGDTYLSINNELWGKLFDSVVYNERYHYSIAISEHSGGLVFAFTDHVRPEIKVKFAPSGDMSQISSEYIVGAADSRLSYLHLVSLADNSLMIFTRGYDDSSATFDAGAIAYRVSGLSTGTVTYTIDVIISGANFYPRFFELQNDSLSEEAVMCVWGRRAGIGEPWAGIYAAVFKPNESSGTGKWYLLTGKEAANNSALGTNGTPRFSPGQRTGETKDDNGVIIVGGLTDHQRYCLQGALSDLREFPSKAKLFVTLAEMAGSVISAYNNTNLQFVIQDGMNRYIGQDDFPMPSMTKPNSYRLDMPLSWKNNDPATGNAVGVLTNRGTKRDINVLGENVNSYYDWGTDRILSVVEIRNPFNIQEVKYSQSEEYLKESVNTSFITKIQNTDNEFLYQKSINELHETHRQSINKSFLHTFHSEPIYRPNIFTGIINMRRGDDLIISGGVITITTSNHRVDTEGGAASDNLDTINVDRGVLDGDLLMLKTINSGRDVVLKHQTGNISIGGGLDVSLDSAAKVAVLKFDSGFWNLISVSDKY